MFCRKCGAEFTDDSMFCFNCGEQVTNQPNEEDMVSQTPEQATAFSPKPITHTDLRKAQKKSSKKGYLILLIVFIVLPAFFSANSNITQRSPSPDANSKRYISATSATVIQAEEFLRILEECGAGEFKSIKYNERLNTDDIKAYTIQTSLVDSIVLQLTLEQEVKRMSYAYKDLYVDGNVVLKLTDMIFTSDERTGFYMICEKKIKDLLKSPSTAKFPPMREWRFGKEDGVIHVQGYVDAQNAFGATMRSTFQFKFKDDLLLSLIFDGQEYVK